MDVVKKKAKRLGIGIVGGLVLLVGIITIPYPGPGWLIVFAGLAILATEFEWARGTLHAAREKYTLWQQWLKNQSLTVRLLLLVFTAIVVIITLWLLNTFALITTVFHVSVPWLHSPFSHYAK